MKNYAPIKALIAFWGWIAVIVLSFMLAILALGKGNLPDAVVFFVALVIFAVSIAVVIVNPGIFAKQHTTETGNKILGGAVFSASCILRGSYGEKRS